MPAQSTMIPQQQLIDAARALVLTYNDRNWEAAKARMSPDFDYDEVSTNRKVKGPDQVIPIWQGWAAAFPDSKGTIHRELTSGNTVVLEVSWVGTHNGPLQTPNGTIPATGRRIDVRACMIVEVADDKAKAQRHYFDMMTLMQQLGVTG
jgi:steroid delta-isomerase-like uncharacterized protein